MRQKHLAGENDGWMRSMQQINEATLRRSDPPKEAPVRQQRAPASPLFSRSHSSALDGTHLVVFVVEDGPNRVTRVSKFQRQDFEIRT